MDHRRDADESNTEAPGPEEYQHLDDKEKDAEIVRSILRLQNKIQMMLYFSPRNLDMKEKHPVTPDPDPEKNDDE